jgi:hypothetical protein
MRREYSWRSGPHPGAGLSPETVGEELNRIEAKNNGKCHAEHVLEAARPEGSVLHSAIFNKPVEGAAEAYYLAQARKLISSLRVTVIEGDKVIGPVRARIALVDEDESGKRNYYPAEEVARNEILNERLREMLMRQLAVLRLQLQQFEEFAAVVGAIDDLAA